MDGKYDFQSSSHAATATLERPTSSRPGIRAELVAQVKQQIAAGIYDTEDKLDAAIETMLHELRQSSAA